ncbi:MAG: hypothetical protein QOG53_1350 [Frankiales bacterium]|nr:hypothetical protein [Frankiales bacterium]
MTVSLLALGVGARRSGNSLMSTVAWCAGVGLGAITAAWSLADQDTTLAALSVLTVAFALAAVMRGPLAGADAGLAVGWLGGLVVASGLASDLARDQTGAVLLVVPAVVVAARLARLLPRRNEADGLAVEGVAAALAAVALLMTVDDAGYVSWVLAGVGLLCLAAALMPDRRPLMYVGIAALTASSWVRLANADVHTPEPYALPVSVVALVIGHLRRRQQPELSSMTAYGVGLTGAFLPSLIYTLGDDGLRRPLLLGLAALITVLAGVRERLRGPLLIGGATLAIDALRQVAPYAAAAPKWISLGGAGLLLVILGATYEKRRQDAERLRALLMGMR